MSSKFLEGVVCPLCAPLDEKERIIEQDVRKLVRYELEHGINGFLVPSGTGEFFALTADERRRFIEIVVDEVQDRVPVIAVVGDCGTRKALQHLEVARQAGADEVMSTPVFFAVVDQRGLKMYFETLADEGDMPLWLYQQPQETKLVIEPETVAELAENPNIVGIKVSHWADLLDYHRVLRSVRHKPAFRVVMGEDHNNLSAYALGGHGAISSLSNVVPEAAVGVWREFKNGSLEAARRHQDRIMEAEELLILRTGSLHAALKLILHQRGIFSTTVLTSPLPPLTDEQREMVLREGKRIGLLRRPS